MQGNAQPVPVLSQTISEGMCLVCLCCSEGQDYDSGLGSQETVPTAHILAMVANQAPAFVTE